MIKNILAIGCSFTHGAELPDETEDHPSQFAWPQLVANRLDANITNLGLNGGSNSRIFRLAVEQAAKKSQIGRAHVWNSSHTDISRMPSSA